MSPKKLTGPLGFWSFPVLKIFINILSAKIEEQITNRIVERMDGNENEKIPQPQLQSTPPSQSTQPTITNTEKWSWLDYKGNKQEITVHREKKINKP